MNNKRLLNSSKRKQKLYDKFLKHKTEINETNYKNYKDLFESIKFKSKKNYYAQLILKYQNNIKKTWQAIKEITGKIALKNDNLPRTIILNNQKIHDKKEIAHAFNHFFINAGPNLASKIP